VFKAPSVLIALSSHGAVARPHDPRRRRSGSGIQAECTCRNSSWGFEPALHLAQGKRPLRCLQDKGSTCLGYMRWKGIRKKSCTPSLAAHPHRRAALRAAFGSGIRPRRRRLSQLTGTFAWAECDHLPLPRGERCGKRNGAVVRMSTAPFDDCWSGKRDSNPRPQPWQGYGVACIIAGLPACCRNLLPRLVASMAARRV